jgi:hypothetical protein
VDAVGVELARGDEFFDLGDADLAGHRGERVEVAGRLVEDEVAVHVAARCVHERIVGDDRLFEHVVALGAVGREGRTSFRGDATAMPPPVVLARQAALGDLRADAGLCEEGGDARAARAQLLGERALRGELEFELTGEELTLELLVLADVGGRHLADALRVQSTPRPQSSTPQLLLTMDRSVVPCARSASMRAMGLPDSPNPPTASEAPSGCRRPPPPPIRRSCRSRELLRHPCVSIVRPVEAPCVACLRCGRRFA